MVIFYLKQFFATMLFIFTSLTLAISGVIVTSPIIYSLAIKWFDLSAVSGLSHEQLMENYNVLISYLVNPAIEALEMPYFSSSENGLFHFEEVKFLFLMCFVVAIVGVIASVITILWIHKQKLQPWMGRWFIIAIAFPLILLFLIVVAFDQVFLLVHQILFRNDLWLFSPVTDPVITVLPESLFMILFVVAILIYEVIIYLTRFTVLYEPSSKRKKR